MTTRTGFQPRTPYPELLLEEGLSGVREALGKLRFGSITLTVHEGRLVQIDVTEKRRLAAS